MDNADRALAALAAICIHLRRLFVLGHGFFSKHERRSSDIWGLQLTMALMRHVCFCGSSVLFVCAHALNLARLRRLRNGPPPASRSPRGMTTN